MGSFLRSVLVSTVVGVAFTGLDEVVRTFVRERVRRSRWASPSPNNNPSL